MSTDIMRINLSNDLNLPTQHNTPLSVESLLNRIKTTNKDKLIIKIMNKLYIKYNVKDINDYYCKISDSYRNGEIALAKEMFQAMPKGYRVDLTKDTLFSWHTITKGEQMFYFNLLTGLTK